MIKALIIILVLAFTAMNYCEQLIHIKHSLPQKCSAQNCNTNVKDESDLIQLRLQKTVYRKYEPIEILAGYINTGSTDDSIYFKFNDFTGFIDFIIEDGKVVNINYALFGYQ